MSKNSQSKLLDMLDLEENNQEFKAVNTNIQNFRIEIKDLCLDLAFNLKQIKSFTKYNKKYYQHLKLLENQANKLDLLENQISLLQNINRLNLLKEELNNNLEETKQHKQADTKKILKEIDRLTHELIMISHFFDRLLVGMFSKWQNQLIKIVQTTNANELEKTELENLSLLLRDELLELVTLL